MISNIIDPNEGVHTSGQRYKDISLEAITVDAPFIVRAKFSGTSGQTDVFTLSEILVSAAHIQEINGDETFAVHRAGAFEWSLAMQDMLLMGVSEWTEVRRLENGIPLDLKIGSVYVLFLTPALAKEFEFFAESAIFPDSEIILIKNLIEKYR